MNKKAIAILGAIFILIVGTLGFLVYSKYGKSDTPPPPGGNGADTATTTPIDLGDGGAPDVDDDTATTTPPDSNGGAPVYRLSEEPVYNPIIFYNGTAISYFNRDGEVYQAALKTDGPVLQLNEKIKLDMPLKPRISRIIWPNQGNDYIAEIEENGGKYFSYFNAQTKTYVDYPRQVISVGWMPAADKIMYIWLGSEGKASLNVADPDTRNWKKVGDMWVPNNQIEIAPNGQSIVFYQVGNPGIKNSIDLVTPDGKVWQGLVKDGYNFGVLWSPDSKKFLFNKKDSVTQKYQLWAYNLETSMPLNLGLFTTVDKAVWAKDSKTVFAAVPKTGSPAAESGSLTQDDFYRLDLLAQTSSNYKISGNSVDGRNLFLNPVSDRLFFKNLQDGYLYYLDIGQSAVSL